MIEILKLNNKNKIDLENKCKMFPLIYKNKI